MSLPPAAEIYYRAWRVSAVVEPQHLLAQLREQGLLLSVVAERVLRFTPPLTLTADELEWGLDTLHSVLRRYRQGTDPSAQHPVKDECL
ncbi:hypothetical protein ACLMAL_24025 [Nocardia sp. CWNU-33]|uniref:hypothetical protein n=1 Tax=Nocardia sp. CWNU-33 TaxID=3392117 RepID=UPI00398E7240